MPHDRFADPVPQHEVDYVGCFERLSAVEVEIRRRGPSPHLLLRRAMLSLALGNYVAGLEAARAAVAVAPRDPEPHYQEGMAWLWLARVQVGGAALTMPGMTPTRRPLRTTLENALEAFSAALACAPDDADAEAAVAWLEHVLDHDGDALAALLQGQA